MTITKQELLSLCFDVNRKARCGELPYEPGKIAREALHLLESVVPALEADRDHLAARQKLLEAVVNAAKPIALGHWGDNYPSLGDLRRPLLESVQALDRFDQGETT